MLEIKVPISPEGWDEKNECFVEPKTQVLRLEHSLVSLSKWESKWCTPFLTKREKTDEEIIDYIKCMTITQNVDPVVYDHLSRENIEQINAYIEAPMTATTIKRNGKKANQKVPTAELIYYWMFSLNIPFECRKWHLNQLITLIEVCSIESSPPKKMSKREVLKQQSELNAARRKALNSKG